MMSLKKLVAVAFMVAAVSVQAEAQGGRGAGGGGGGGGGGRGAQTVEQAKAALFAGITLDAAQTSKVDSILTATAAKRTEMMQAMRDGGGDRESMMAKTQEMQTAERTALRGALTAAQQPIFDKNVENMPARGRRPPPMI